MPYSKTYYADLGDGLKIIYITGIKFLGIGPYIKGGEFSNYFLSLAPLDATIKRIRTYHALSSFEKLDGSYSLENTNEERLLPYIDYINIKDCIKYSPLERAQKLKKLRKKAFKLLKEQYGELAIGNNPQQQN